MDVFIERTRESKSISASSVSDLLSQLSINPETVLVTKNDELVTEEETLSSEDKVKILSVISGG